MTSELSPKATEIAAIARDLLVSRGYHGFSYADVSEAVGITKASVHHHFPSKAELVLTVVQRYRAEARAGLGSLAGIADARVQLEAYAGFLAQCVREKTLSFCICAMLATEIETLPEDVALEVRGHFDDLVRWLAAVLEDGAAAGHLRLASDARAEALVFMAAIHGAMVSARAFGDPEVFATVAAALVQRVATVH